MQPKTSTTSPLKIDWLETGRPGRVGLTLAPGKKSTSRDGTRWDRDLAADLDVLVGADVTQLVCLLEDADLRSLKIASLRQAVEARGIRYVHFPIRDVDVPPSRRLAELDALLEGIEAAVADGGRVVIHCEGGLGRTGLVAGCYLVRRGLGAKAALAELRRVRKSEECPQTAKQRDFIADYARRHEGPRG